MSKLARKPIPIPDNVTVTEKDGVFELKGPKGTLIVKPLDFTKIELKDNAFKISRIQNHKQARANEGTAAALVKIAIEGVTKGFSKTLKIEGVGYRAAMEGKDLVLNIGYSHPVKYSPPKEISITVNKNTITISGIDKALVGQVAATIRALKKPEPYKGYGIRYDNEIIRRKVGKKAAGGES